MQGAGNGLPVCGVELLHPQLGGLLGPDRRSLRLEGLWGRACLLQGGTSLTAGVQLR